MINVVVSGKVTTAPKDFGTGEGTGGMFVLTTTVFRDKIRQMQRFQCYYQHWQKKTVERIVKKDALLVVTASDVDMIPDNEGNMVLCLSVVSIDYAG